MDFSIEFAPDENSPAWEIAGFFRNGDSEAEVISHIERVIYLYSIERHGSFLGAIVAQGLLTENDQQTRDLQKNQVQDFFKSSVAETQRSDHQPWLSLADVSRKLHITSFRDGFVECLIAHKRNPLGWIDE